MTLQQTILSRLAIFFLLIIGVWSIGFYFTIISEVYDETDDYLEDYARRMIVLTLSGKKIPQKERSSDVPHYHYEISPVSKEIAQTMPATSYIDEMVFVPEKEETEPVRTLKTVFQDANSQYYLLTISIPGIEKSDLIESILNYICYLFLFLLIALLSVNYFVFRREMRPLFQLLHWLKQYRIGEKESVPRIHTRIGEFKELQQAMEISVIKNEDIFERQKQFISNASHELQTPLAACQNSLELLAENEKLDEQELAEILKILKRLNDIIKLNKTMLFLSKIENAQFVERQDIVCNQIIDKLLADFKEAYQYQHITLSVQQTGNFIATINTELAHSMFTNLIKNAYIHNTNNGIISIDISETQIRISNTGVVESLDQQQLFSRFYVSKQRKADSTGLGLAIVHSICEQNKLDIRYEYNEGYHHFIVSHIFATSSDRKAALIR